MSDPVPSPSWRRPTTRGRMVAVLAPIVFLVEFALALAGGYARDWVMALAIAAVITPVTMLLVALFWRPPREAAPGE